MVGDISERFIAFLFESAILLQNLPKDGKNPFDTPANLNLVNTFIKSKFQTTLFLVQTESNEYQLVEELSTSINFNSAIAIIKLKEPINPDISFSSQIHILNIPTTSVASNFETIRSLITFGVTPYFDVITRENDQASISVVRKKINELSITLQNLQLNIIVPDLLSTIHPKITENNYQSIDSIPESTITDSSFLNELTSIANHWIKQIQSITSLTHNPLDGDSILEEISFWRSMTESLNALKQQLDNPYIKLTLEILKRAKRYHVTMGFVNETGLDDKIVESINYNSLLREFSFDDMLSINSKSPSIDTLHLFADSISTVFSLFRKLKNFPNYPILRSIELVEVILRDINTKFIEILSNFYVMSLPMEKFNELLKECSKIFEVIEESINSTTNLIRELVRKRQEKFVIVKINDQELPNLKNRLEILLTFRLKHNDLLRSTEVVEIFNPTSGFQSDLAAKLVDAFNQFILPINVVDTTLHGSNIWISNESMYSEIFQECQSTILSQINTRLEFCQTFNDYFSVMVTSSLTGYDVMQYINEEHKLNCMAQVEQEVDSLLTQSRQNNQIIKDLNSYYCGHGLVSTHNKSNTVESILWFISVRNSVEYYKNCLEQMFGFQWHEYSIGKKIQNDINSVLNHTKLDLLVEAWIEDASATLDNLPLKSLFYK